MRNALAMLAVLVLVGCGGRPAPLRELGDGGEPADGRVTGDAGTLAAFCSGGARMTVNGATTSAATTGRALWPNMYCEAANVAFEGSATPKRVVLNWQAPASPDPVAPFKLDLDDLPAGWTVRLFVGCAPSEDGCTPDDTIETGFAGSILVEGSMLDYTVTTCLEFVEDPAHPRHELHSARLWAEDVYAPYPWD